MLPDVLPFFEKGNVIVEVEQDRNYEENKVSPRILFSCSLSGKKKNEWGCMSTRGETRLPTLLLLCKMMNEGVLSVGHFLHHATSTR